MLQKPQAPFTKWHRQYSGNLKRTSVCDGWVDIFDSSKTDVELNFYCSS